MSYREGEIMPSGFPYRQAPHPLCGSDSERQSVGAPGHCEDCVSVGHVLAHPHLGCGGVGCDKSHDEVGCSCRPGYQCVREDCVNNPSLIPAAQQPSMHQFMGVLIAQALGGTVMLFDADLERFKRDAGRVRFQRNEADSGWVIESEAASVVSATTARAPHEREWGTPMPRLLACCGAPSLDGDGEDREFICVNCNESVPDEVGQAIRECRCVEVRWTCAPGGDRELACRCGLRYCQVAFPQQQTKCPSFATEVGNGITCNSHVRRV